MTQETAARRSTTLNNVCKDNFEIGIEFAKSPGSEFVPLFGLE